MIYLLINGEASGPHAPGDVEGMLDAGTIEPDCFAVIDGMKDWRSVGETLVWARGRSLIVVRDVILEQVLKVNQMEINDTYAISAILQAMRKINPGIGLEIHGSIRLILQTNVNLLFNCQHARDHVDAECLEIWPAWELLLFGKQNFPRDWPKAWLAAGGKIYNDRMIARKDSPVWLNLSDFGFPFAPFSFEPNHATEEVGRDECLSNGVIHEGDPPIVVAGEMYFDLVGVS